MASKWRLKNMLMVMMNHNECQQTLSLFAIIKKRFFLLPAIVIITACGQGSLQHLSGHTDTLTEEQRHLSVNALKGLDIAEGLEVKLMAAEPMIKNPTNIDVDDRGRIWVTEAYNYRPNINGNPVNPEGDRIIILEDKDSDGIAETSTVFYQGPEMNAPLGVCVLGNRVLVSQSPYVWAFFDDNADDKADRKEILFQGIGGVQHDHGIHSFSAGADGKLYFNFGNKGETLRDKNNHVVLDQDGDPITNKKYKQGMVFRCNADGSNVECLGNNFRNNYELAVDSYGTMWQSDNDDDGNRGVRINYVMDYGNFGYTDEMKGSAWSAPRTNMEDSIPLQHWHLNDPGVVPNILQTGSGSPAGMIVYEGSLLPGKFTNQIIHCDPGHNVVRAYPVKKDGAGYHASIENILIGEKDQWFRPVDICTAPDGSLIVADWYDPGVGGHGAGDQQKGRIYRIAPKGSRYKISKPDYSTASGAVAALQNPNLSTRYHAWIALQQMGPKAVPVLEELWKFSPDSRMRARSFWALVKMPGGEKYITEAIKQTDPDIKIAGLRAARQLHINIPGFVAALVNDNDPQIRRECALALHHNTSTGSPKLWATLAQQHDGKDRWYLEALGIGAADQWDNFFKAYRQEVKDPAQSNAGRDIVWRSRTSKTLPLLAILAVDSVSTWKSRQRYFRAFDFNKGAAKATVLIKMIADNNTNNTELNVLLLHHLDPKDVRKSAIAANALKEVLKAVYGTTPYIQLVNQYELKTESSRLLELAIDKPFTDIAIESMRLYFKFEGEKNIRIIVKGKDTTRAVKVMQAIGRAGLTPMIDILQDLLLSKSYSKSLRLAAADNIGKSYGGEDRVIQLLQTKQLPEELIPAAVQGLKEGRSNIYKKALSFLPGAVTKVNENKGVTINDLLVVQTNINNGLKVFRTNCSICHQVKEEGKDFGPRLTEIADKLPKEGLLDAIINPSGAVNFGYETSQLTMNSGSTINGIIVSKTETDITIKFPGGSIEKISGADVKAVKKIKESMMPALHESMTKQELADLLAYLSTLTRK